MNCGKKVCFHGAFRFKDSAKRKEKQVGGFIRKITVRGETRYVVMTGGTRKFRSQVHG